MDVILIAQTPYPYDVLYIVGKTSTSVGIPKLNHKDKYDFVNTIINSGHMSVLEHVSYTFFIKGITRRTATQLVRYRHTSVVQQSLRYIEVPKENVPYYYYEYKRLIDSGIAKEDARDVLPLGTLTNLSITVNLAELIHMSKQRLCRLAQNEITEVIREMGKQTEFHKYMKPKCFYDGYCREIRNKDNKVCHLKPYKELF